MNKGDAIKGGAIKGDAIKGGAIKGGAIKGDAIKGDAIKGGAIKGDAIKGDAIKISVSKTLPPNYFTHQQRMKPSNMKPSTMKPSNILITGVAGFIGYHIASYLLAQGHKVLGIDNLNRFYSQTLKADRLKLLQQHPSFTFIKANIANRRRLLAIFSSQAFAQPFDNVIHLAAQAGVRYSIQHPTAYGQSNLIGFLNLLEACRHHAPKAQILYASSSSVYGANTALPFVETMPCDHPISLYGATKRSNELMAHAYAHLYGLALTGLRFFTVYGPYGRPDMAIFRFTQALIANRPLMVYNEGKMYRSFTYIDDVVQATTGLLQNSLLQNNLLQNSLLNSKVQAKEAKPTKNKQSKQDGQNGQDEKDRQDKNQGPASSPVAPYRIVNIGGAQQHSVQQCIDYIEQALRKRGWKGTVRRNLLPIQAGDVLATKASTEVLDKLLSLPPATSLQEGIDNFVHWYCTYYKIKI